MLSRTDNERHCNYILCFFFHVRGSAVGRQSGCAVQCTNLEGCMQPSFFRGWLYISWMCTPEQSGSSCILCNILTHSSPQPTELTFSTPPVSSSSPLVACPDYLPVQKPIKTYSRLSTTTSKTFSSTEPSIPHGCVNENACGGELGSVSLQSSSPKRKARQSILKKLDLDRVAELTPRKKNSTTWFGPERLPFASLGRSAGQRSWRRFVSRRVILWYSLFHLLWI